MSTTNNSTKPSKLAKFIMISLSILSIFLSYVMYQVITSEALTPEKKEKVFSLFEKKEEEKLFSLEEFTLKLVDGHYVRLSMNVGYFGEEESLKPLTPILRDKVIFELMKLEEKNLDVTEINKTKALLIEKINPLLEEAEVQNIYIDNMILQ